MTLLKKLSVNTKKKDKKKVSKYLQNPNFHLLSLLKFLIYRYLDRYKVLLKRLKMDICKNRKKNKNKCGFFLYVNYFVYIALNIKRHDKNIFALRVGQARKKTSRQPKNNKSNFTKILCPSKRDSKRNRN